MVVMVNSTKEYKYHRRDLFKEVAMTCCCSLRRMTTTKSLFGYIFGACPAEQQALTFRPIVSYFICYEGIKRYKVGSRAFKRCGFKAVIAITSLN